jgi:hypothetical protein
MPAIIRGFQYDIFVSYRHNDNKYDGWVTEFVEKLHQELDATLKDKLSIFFDRNPKEGLHESHRVDESINNKIKSLIFIPIISQTYCDTDSFAWKHEFKAFKSEVGHDSLGQNVELANGNFASRILPIKIHDIDNEDIKLLESELSGALRSIDFIYRDSGVNRSLRPVDDDLARSQVRVLYRNQINKMANAIKEIIQAIRQMERKDVPARPVPAHDLTARQILPSIFSTSLPPGIKVQVVDRERPSVYLAWTSSDIKEQREEMAIILQKAGFNVVPAIDCPADDNVFKEKVAADLAKCSCSLHMLSGEFGRRFERDEETSFPQFQFLEAKKRLETDTEFHAFIWLYPDASGEMKPAQKEFVRFIRNNITRNMMFSNSPGSMQLVDDIRVVMVKQEEAVYDSKDTDIFFIFNQQDEQDAMLITDALSNEYPVEILNILPDGEDQYRDISSQQIPRSKLAVVYFKYAADWALPFIKQIWKQVGGASSPTPLFLVGEDDPKSNLARNFKAPKVVSIIVPKENVPAEVKKVYTNVIDLR